MLATIFFFIAIASVILGGQHRTSVIACDSVSCVWNKQCNCTRKDIAIYDNKAKGMCLYHTSTARTPIRRERFIEGTDDKTLDKIMELQDEKILKDPDTFAKWMKMNLKKERRKAAMNPVFRYRAKDAEGIDKEGEVEAVDEKAAAKELQEQGLFIISLDKVGKNGKQR